MLYRQTAGPPGRPPVVLVHGFTQSGRSWNGISQRLAERYQVTTIDAPGHGRSAVVEADLPGGGDLMVEAAPRPAAWVGYSMGGRFALHAALRHPDAFTKLVLVSATAGIDDEAERTQRRRSDADLADRVEREGLETFVRWWLSQPMFASLGADEAMIASRLEGSAKGLASSLRLAGTGSQMPLWDDLGRLHGIPTLLVAGERDEKYTAVARRLLSAIGPNASLAVIPDAGHACHLERPDQFVAAVNEFLGSPAP